jgi:2-oxoglutarate dehydrogenase E2 component (dihydrolipoamide succinyltransferase)
LFLVPAVSLIKATFSPVTGSLSIRRRLFIGRSAIFALDTGQMSVEVKIPAVGESITSGIVSVWHKKSGDFVNPGDALFTLETDKVSTEITAERAGVLQTNVNEGQEVKIGEVVATIDDSKTVPAKPEPAEKKAAPDSKPATKPEAKSTAEKSLSPAVRRIVEEEKIDTAGMSGSGKGGRLTKGDVLGATQFRGEAEAPEPLAKTDNRPDRQSPDGRFTRKKMSPLRRKIAAQLVMAQHTAAILTTFNECDMRAVQELRAKSQEAFTKKNGVKLGFMSFFIKATIEGLKAVPALNGRIEDEDFIENHFYDIGVAVGTERGLIVPVIRDADKKTFAELERDIADYAAKAREGKLKIEDLQGGTFTIHRAASSVCTRSWTVRWQLTAKWRFGR